MNPAGDDQHAFLGQRLTKRTGVAAVEPPRKGDCTPSGWNPYQDIAVGLHKACEQTQVFPRYLFYTGKQCVAVSKGVGCEGFTQGRARNRE